MKMLAPLFMAALAAAPAYAGGKAVLETGNGRDRTQSTLEYDGSRLRMDVAGEPGAYVLLRDGKVYSVIARDGQPTVLDMQGMGTMFGGAGAAGFEREVQTFVSLDDTGRSETVAGIAGRVHVLRYTDRQGRTQREEIVLARDARLREMTESMLQLGRSLAASPAPEAATARERLSAEIIGKGQGVLRYGADYRLVSISGDTPPSARFALPAAPVQMPTIAGTGGGAGPLGAILGRKAERQQQRVEDRADQEVDGATDRAVDKVLDQAFKKLFE